MREKIVGGFFAVLSWCVWGVCIAAVFFGLSTLFTGVDKQPEVTVNAALLTDLGETDGAHDYRLELDLTFSADKTSPYRFEAKSLTVENAAALGFYDARAELTEDLSFSRIEPQETTVIVYFSSDRGINAVNAGYPALGLSLGDSASAFAFWRIPLRDHALTFPLTEAG